MIKFFLKMIICFGIGFLGAATELVIRREELKRTKGIFYWFLLTRYTVGTIMLSFALIINLYHKNCLEDVLYRFYAGSLGVGLGVALRFLIDSEKLQLLDIAS